MKLPILSGVYTNSKSDVRAQYPVNLVPVVQESGVSEGYLRPSDGVLDFATGLGNDRGGINWNDTLYRVSGDRLISISSDGSTVTSFGAISGTGLVEFDYSFTYMSICTDEKAWLFDGTTLTQIVDVDLGNVISHIWVDGYFMFTDGEYLIVTELANPFSVDPAKYGSSEVDPDPIKAVLKPKNEPHALNRHTIEVFYNTGGAGFPFTRIASAIIKKGTVGTRTCCVIGDAVAFMGGGRNESISIYIGAGGVATKIAPKEIDQLINEYTEAELAECQLETKFDETELLYVHLPDLTLVYDKEASTVYQTPIWYILTNTISENNPPSKIPRYKKYHARNMVKCYNKWIVGDSDSTSIGYLTDTVQTLWGSDVRWEFDTIMLYNAGKMAIIYDLELVGLTGRQAAGANPTMYTCYSDDGINFSQRKRITLGERNNTTKRMMWINQGSIKNIRVQRFTGLSDAMASFLRLEARVEGMM